MTVRPAHYIRVDTCSNGCPVLVLLGEDGVDFAEAHIADVERLIADLRSAKMLGEAQRRPLV